jgi:hypothetical protein
VIRPRHFLAPGRVIALAKKISCRGKQAYIAATSCMKMSCQSDDAELNGNDRQIRVL